MRYGVALLSLIAATVIGLLAFAGINLFESEIGRPRPPIADAEVFPGLHMTAVTPGGFVAVTQQNYHSVLKNEPLIDAAFVSKMIEKNHVNLLYMPMGADVKGTVLWMDEDTTTRKYFSTSEFQVNADVVIQGFKKDYPGFQSLFYGWTTVDNLPAFSYTFKYQMLHKSTSTYVPLRVYGWISSDNHHIHGFSCTAPEIRVKRASEACRQWIQSIRFQNHPKWYERRDYATPVRILMVMLGSAVVLATIGIALLLLKFGSS